MSHTYSKNWIHLVWRTWESHPVLTPSLRPVLFDHIIAYASSRGYTVDRVNGVEDHVHCLVRFEPRHAVSDIVNAIKGESSHWINAGRRTPERFAWQQGFSSFTVSPTAVNRVRRYIERQEEHHRRTTADQEIEMLARLFGADEDRGDT